jgi:hypothetical protein
MQKISAKTDVSRLLKKWIREVAGARNNCRIVVVDGDSPPKLRGKSYYHTNKSGDIIRHPNAYKRAWGKPIYVPSSIRVEVGSQWLLNGLSFKKVKFEKLAVFK